MSSTTIDLSAPVDDAYRRIAPCFGRSETRARSRRYLAGLLSTTERKNGTVHPAFASLWIFPVLHHVEDGH